MNSSNHNLVASEYGQIPASLFFRRFWARSRRDVARFYEREWAIGISGFGDRLFEPHRWCWWIGPQRLQRIFRVSFWAAEHIGSTTLESLLK